jgi:UDP-N-acetylglucosamine 2-epimerase
MSQDELLKAMSQASNPYGDGNAAQRCVSMIDEFFGYGVRSTEFVYVA